MLFKQGDKFFISNQNEKAVELYKKVVKNNDDSRLVMLSTYKLGYIYETRLFKYDDALQWYKELMSKFPDSRHAKLARTKFQKIITIKNTGKLDIYGAFKKARWDYYTSKKYIPYKESQNKAISLYKYAVKYQKEIFSEEMVQDSFEILFNADLFSLANKAGKKFFSKYPILKEKYANMTTFIKGQLLRKSLFIISLLLMAVTLLMSLIFKTFMNTILLVLRNIKKHWLFFLIFFVVFSAFYIIAFSLSNDIAYKLFDHIGLLVVFLFSYLWFALFNETANSLTKKEWITYMTPILSLVFAGSWLIAYAYLFDYMWLFGI